MKIIKKHIILKETMTIKEDTLTFTVQKLNSLSRAHFVSTTINTQVLI